MYASSPEFRAVPVLERPGPAGGTPSAAPIHVHLVAPPLTSWGLQRLVQGAGAPLCLTGVSSTLGEAMHALERHPPDVVVLDLDDGYGVPDVAALYEALRVKILVLASSDDDALLAGVLRAGARGVLRKRNAPAALLKALQAIGEGEILLAPRETDRAPRGAIHTLPATRSTDAHRIATLTPRERQTIAAVTACDCAPAKVVAAQLCISEHTLRNRLTAIYSKLGVTGRLALHAYASLHHLGAPAAEGSRRS